MKRKQSLFGKKIEAVENKKSSFQTNIMMNHEEKEIKDPFFDKLDENYMKITSPTYFYEIFAKKKIKCDVKIPQTIICEAGKKSFFLY